MKSWNELRWWESKECSELHAHKRKKEKQMKSLEEIVEDNYRACQCPDGCNGCERLTHTQIAALIHHQRQLWPVGSPMHKSLKRLLYFWGYCG